MFNPIPAQICVDQATICDNNPSLANFLFALTAKHALSESEELCDLVLQAMNLRNFRK